MIYRTVVPRRRDAAGMPKTTSGIVTCGFRWRSGGRIWPGTLDSVSGKTKPQKPARKRQAELLPWFTARTAVIEGLRVGQAS